MMYHQHDQTLNQPAVAKPVGGKRGAKSKAEDHLIEEILKAAGLEPLD